MPDLHLAVTATSQTQYFKENSIETCILSRVKQITSPGWMHETSARAWCTGKTWRDRDGEYLYIHDWFMSMYDKNHYNKKKKKKKKQNKKQKKLEASSLYNKEVLSHHTWWLNYAWEKELF